MMFAIPQAVYGKIPRLFRTNSLPQTGLTLIPVRMNATSAVIIHPVYDSLALPQSETLRVPGLTLVPQTVRMRVCMSESD